LDVFDSTSSFTFSRVGIVVPKHKRSAVERNLLKRRLREVVRKQVLPKLRDATMPLDILVRARREAYLATYSQLQDELIALIDRKWPRVS
jgi:ribonuclease P protein component